MEYRDWRDLPADARYDKVAAIGVIEHVGVPNYPAFFGRVRTLLNDGGLYLNHGIHHEFHWRRTSQTDFLFHHVFPNGDLSGFSETVTEMERVYRTWLLYLTCSAVAFAAGSIGLYQVLMRKQGDRTGGTAPTTRDGLYIER